MFGRDSGPIDYLRGRAQNWQAHPFQNIASTVFGGFVPGGGIAANALFNRYNDNRFNNSAQQFQDFTRDQSNLNTNDAMNKPLSGPLGAFDRQNPYGSETGPAQGMGPQGGPSPYSGGYNSQNWNLQQMTSGNAPNQPSSFVNDILNSISTGPGQPGTQTGGLFDTPRGPEARREGGFSGGPGMGNYGVSNLNVGGAPVIFGSGDPNGRYRNRGSQYGG